MINPNFKQRYVLKISLFIINLIIWFIFSLHSGCFHIKFDPSSLRPKSKVAVIGIVDCGPELLLSSRNVEKIGKFLSQRATNDLKGQIRKKLSSMVTSSEISEFMRQNFSSLLSSLGQFEVVSHSRVASALGFYLIDERSVDYGNLRPLKIEAVFEITLESYGLSDRGGDERVGYFISVSARLIDVESGRVLWRMRAEHDGSDSGKYLIDLKSFADDPTRTFRYGFGRLIERSMHVLVSDLKLSG
jgi:hypothetical protein